MKAGMKVKMTKMSENKRGYVAIGDVYEGTLANDVGAGERLFLDGGGGLVTSQIEKIEPIEPGMNALHTQNSVWKIEEVR